MESQAIHASTHDAKKIKADDPVPDTNNDSKAPSESM